MAPKAPPPQAGAGRWGCDTRDANGHHIAQINHHRSAKAPARVAASNFLSPICPSFPAAGAAAGGGVPWVDTPSAQFPGLAFMKNEGKRGSICLCNVRGPHVGGDLEGGAKAWFESPSGTGVRSWQPEAPIKGSRRCVTGSTARGSINKGLHSPKGAIQHGGEHVGSVARPLGLSPTLTPAGRPCDLGQASLPLVLNPPICAMGERGNPRGWVKELSGQLT